MDRSAIEKISELAIDANKLSHLTTHTPAFLYGDKVISLEHLNKGRSRFRGKFKTTALADFVTYVKDNSVDPAEGFIDPKLPHATVFFNLGTEDDPGHGDWTANLALEPTAGFAALQAVEGKPLSQKDLAEWIEDWLPNLEARNLNGGEEGGARVSMIAAVTAIRNLTISAKSETTHSDRDFGAARTAFEEIEARSKEGNGIPTHLVFRVEPYAGFQTRDFVLRISVITGDKPALKLRIVSKETVFEDIAREFKALLITEVGDAATLTIGAFTP